MTSVSKVEVAQRLLVEAIRLFFDLRDNVAIHTIVAAGHQVLFDLNQNSGFKGVLKNTAGMRTEEVQEHLRNVNYPYNFFKHADRDPDGSINLGPLERYTQDFVMDAVILLQQFAGDLPFEAKVFWMWFVGRYPEEFDNLPESSEIRKLQEVGVAQMEFADIAKFLRMWALGSEGDLTAEPRGYGAEFM